MTTPNGDFARFWCYLFIPMTTLRLFLFSLLLLSGALSAQVPHKETFQLGPWEKDIGYVHALRVGNTLYISGSVGSGAMPKALEDAFETLRVSLAHYKLSFANVVKETIYTTDIEALKAAKEVRKKFYGNDFPTATWVQVSRLYEPDHVVEVELIAVMAETPSSASTKSTPTPKVK